MVNGTMDEPLVSPVLYSTFWKASFKQKLLSIFHIIVNFFRHCFCNLLSWAILGAHGAL